MSCAPILFSGISPHPPWAEHPDRELKDLTGPGKAKTTTTHDAAVAVLNHRPRPTRGWKSARDPRRHPTVVRSPFRERVYKKARKAINDIETTHLTPRAHRLAVREATH